MVLFIIYFILLCSFYIYYIVFMLYILLRILYSIVCVYLYLYIYAVYLYVLYYLLYILFLFYFFLFCIIMILLYCVILYIVWLYYSIVYCVYYILYFIDYYFIVFIAYTYYIYLYGILYTIMYIVMCSTILLYRDATGQNASFCFLYNTRVCVYAAPVCMAVCWPVVRWSCGPVWMQGGCNVFSWVACVLALFGFDIMHVISNWTRDRISLFFQKIKGGGRCNQGPKRTLAKILIFHSAPLLLF